MGNSLSTIAVSPGEHTIGVKKNGHTSWEMKIKASSGKVNISAELEAEVKQTSPEMATNSTPDSEESKQKTEVAASARSHLSPFSGSTFVRLLRNASRALAKGRSDGVQWRPFFRL